MKQPGFNGKSGRFFLPGSLGKKTSAQGCRAVLKDWGPEGANRATRIQTWPDGRNLAILLGFLRDYFC